MNKVFLIGNLTRDPELTETANGVKVCRFVIAVNRNYTSADGERKTDFFNVTTWRGLAETVHKHVKKGNKVAVTGSLENRNYEDSAGVKRTPTEVVAQDVEFLTSHNTQFDENRSDAMNADKNVGNEDIPF